MERFSHTPHDAIFRQMLTLKEVARDFLQLYLPAQFLRICDLDTLPLVEPILFYHGSVSPWPHTLNWHHLFDDPELASALYSGDFPLVDLTVMPDNQIVRHQRMAMLELLQKHIRQRDLAELQPMLITLLAQGYLTETQINTLISYMLQAGTTEKPGPLIRELAKQSPRHKELLMTIAE